MRIIVKYSILLTKFAPRKQGEMLEWLKRHAWKACKPLKGFAGSNPAFSAGNKAVTKTGSCLIYLCR